MIDDFRRNRSGLCCRFPRALVYVGATYLLPRADREHERFSIHALAGGILLAVIIVVSRNQGT